VRGVLLALPTPEVLRASLSLRYRVGIMQLGSELWAEQRRAAQERRRIEAIEEDRVSGQRRRAAEERGYLSDGEALGLAEVARQRDSPASLRHAVIRPRGCT